MVEHRKGSGVCRDLCTVASAKIQEGRGDQGCFDGRGGGAGSGAQGSSAARAALLDDRGRHSGDRGARRYRAGERELEWGDHGEAGEGSVCSASNTLKQNLAMLSSPVSSCLI